jgi:acylphosphatase
LTGKTRKRVVVSGMVQGVSFRAFTKRAARNLGVVGWVRNLPDGRVEAVIEGTTEQLTQMLAWFRKGSPYGRVDNVETFDITSVESFTDFDIRFTGGYF